MPLLTKVAFAALGAPDLVYVRPVRAGDVGGAALLGIEANQTLYAVHRADGERLAVMVDREAAYTAAEAHDLSPVSVH